MRPLFILCLATALFMGCGCRQKSALNSTEVPRRPTYSQSFKSNVALLVLEWNGQPSVFASGFVTNKEKGIFTTARHFTDAVRNQGTDRCKLFANGMVYDAYIMKVPPLRDAALLRIEGAFDPDDLSDPDPISQTSVQMGDTVFFRGLHGHPWEIRELNRTAGAEDVIVPVLREHYGIIMHDYNRESEIVYDNLEATVTKLDYHIQVAPEEGVSDGLEKIRHDANTYYELKIKRSHIFSFKGLSGGSAVNARGEIIGLNTAEEPQHLEIVPDGDPKKLKPVQPSITIEVRVVHDTLYVTPIQAIRDLYEYAERVE